MGFRKPCGLLRLGIAPRLAVSAHPAFVRASFAACIATLAVDLGFPVFWGCAFLIVILAWLFVVIIPRVVAAWYATPHPTQSPGGPVTCVSFTARRGVGGGDWVAEYHLPPGRNTPAERVMVHCHGYPRSMVEEVATWVLADKRPGMRRHFVAVHSA